ncbi:MAG: virginiamycin lyase [Alphaproteobacteria bacterium]|nr:virginiamycin lyase [Alphaproteobacteria bacterium]
MRLRMLALLAATPLTTILAGTSLPAHAQSKAALTGKVAAAEEAAMEGVIVSAKKGIVTVSVVTNDKGEFSFPADKLGAGDYALSIKAAGYDLDGPKTVTLAPDKAAATDVKLVKTRNLAAQLTNLEWITSIPGTDSQRKLISGCTNCHSVQRIMMSTFNADEWMQVTSRMATYSNNSFFLKPQVRAEARSTARFTPNGEKDAEYFASINRSEGPLKYELKTLPRVSGSGTKVVITEYDLPHKDWQPHDVLVEADGTVWYSDFGDQRLGRLDPKTLEFKEYSVPLHREGWPKGALDLEPDPQGNLWMGLMFQAGVARFDKKTDKVETFPLPADVITKTSQQAMVAPHNMTVDNKVWMGESNLGGLSGVRRIDLTTGKFETWSPYKDMPKSPHSVYGINADKENNLWFFDFGADNVGKIDAKSGTVTLYPTPTKKSKPRRGRFDTEGRLWFAEFGGERVGMFDTKTESFKEWEVPGRYFAPYDAAADKEGKVWTAGMNADRVLRLDPETGRFVEYPLPRYTNVRRIFVDNSTARPTLWIGNNHGAAIIKLEMLD